LYVIAARKDVPQIKQFGDAFLSIDVDGNGQVSCDELADAVDAAGHWWGPRIDAQRLFDAMDMDLSGSVSFTKFIAACIYASFSSVEELFASAFAALDVARRGAVSVQDVARLFPHIDVPAMRYLPQNHWFSADEWVAHLAIGCSLKVVACPPKRARQPAGFFDRFFCTTPHRCDARGAEYIVERCGTPVAVPHRPVSCF